jgi:hypothetical protein
MIRLNVSLEFRSSTNPYSSIDELVDKTLEKCIDRSFSIIFGMELCMKWTMIIIGRRLLLSALDDVEPLYATV